METKIPILDTVEGTKFKQDWILPPVEVSAGLPDKFSRKDLTKGVMNQGADGACVGFSCSVVAQDTDDYRHLSISPYWIWNRAKLYDHIAGEDYEGTTVSGACEQMHKEGLLTDWEYDNLTLHRRHLIADHRKILSYHKISLDRSEEIKELLKHKSILMSVRVYDWFSYSKKIRGGQTVVDVIAGKGNRRGGHAVAIVGYEYIDGKLHWEIQNSWGDWWGDGGHALIPHSTLSKISIRAPYYIITKSDEEKRIREANERLKGFKKLVFKVRNFFRKLRGKL